MCLTSGWNEFIRVTLCAGMNRGLLEHIIWDWNGTLVDDAWLCIEITNGFLEEQGLPSMTEAHYQEVFGFPVRDYYARLGLDFSKRSYEDLADEWIAQYAARRTECKLQSGAKDVLAFMKASRLSQSVLSVYMQSSLEMMIEHYSLSSYFVAVCGLKDHFAHSKVELGREQMKARNLDPASTVLVGDTIHDHEVASAIGIDCVLIPGGHQSAERLASTGAEVIQSLDELRHITSG